MFDLVEVVDEIHKILPKAKVKLAARSTDKLELYIIYDCPKSGVRFGQASSIKVIDLLNCIRPTEFIRMAKSMCSEIIEHPDFIGEKYERTSRSRRNPI